MSVFQTDAFLPTIDPMELRTPMMSAALALLATQAGAVGVEPVGQSRRDRVETLYADQLLFDHNGEPLVSVRILKGQRRIRLRAEVPLILSPGDEAGSRVITPAGSTWTVTLDDPHGGRTRSWVVAERFGGSNFDRVATARARWRGMGHEVRVFESGTLLALAGHTLDTRAVTIGISPAADRRLAQQRASALAGASIMGRIYDEYLERPGGWIVAEERSSGMMVRGRNLLSVTPVRDWGVTGTVEVFDVNWPRHGAGARRYEGTLYFLVGTDLKLMAINLVAAETVLRGVVPAEIFPNAPREALRAQAVAARGMLLSKVGVRHRGEPYQLCAEPHCQAYSGAGAATPATSAAVTATRGEVLVGPSGFTDTVYHSACGGHTEAWHAMWGGSHNSTMPGVNDAAVGGGPVNERAAARFIAHPPRAWCAPSAKRSKVFRWVEERSGRRISDAVNAQTRVGAVHTIKPLKRGRSGRVLAVEYVGTEGRHVARGGSANRPFLGGLKSGLWVIERQGGAAGGEPDTWVIRGGGFGHGVGMCQHGAMGLADAGRSYREILRHYYPNTELRKVW